MKLHLVTGDITALEVDAIVNAANTSMAGGTAVEGAALGQQFRADRKSVV